MEQLNLNHLLQREECEKKLIECLAFFEENKNEIAAIVLEPVIFSKPDDNFL